METKLESIIGKSLEEGIELVKSNVFSVTVNREYEIQLYNLLYILNKTTNPK